MSGCLNESKNYIWNTECEADCLGAGTFGKVYRGIHKKTGDKVAVKTFKQVNQAACQETKMLQSLQHQYIIQLYDIEVEKLSKNEVMIMELCNGGSLMNFLNQPENVLGLPDKEFLLVTEHLSGGLEYLKRHNVIHRDVKPDNIMRQVLDDGRTIYKLADFGTARELPEGQNFYSLHGTEPYLNPKMFKALFFGNQCTREFGPDTDLWSVGVTLYQTATGHLPFAMQSRHLMWTTYSEMERRRGIISAIQQSNSEEIVYQDKLPQNCRLSVGLRQLITPIIAGLFIQDGDEQWSFSNYYDKITELVSRRVFNVFNVNKMQLLKIYVKPDETFADFKRHVLRQSDVRDEDQVFLYKEHLIVNRFDDFPRVESECIFLFDRTNREVEFRCSVQPNLETLSNFQTARATEACDYYRLAYRTRRDLCLVKNVMELQSTVCKYFSIFIRAFQSYCKEELAEQRKLYDMLIEKYSETKKRICLLEKLERLSRESDIFFVENFSILTTDFMNQASQSFDELNTARVELNLASSHDSYFSIATAELAEINPLLKSLCRSTADSKLYEFERTKFCHCVRTIREIFTEKVEPNFDDFVKVVKEWYQSEFFSNLKALSNLKNDLNSYRANLKKFDDEIHSRSDNSVSSIVSRKSAFTSQKKLKETLEQYRQNSHDMASIIEKNTKLVEKMNELILSLDMNLSTEV
ncbi:hypothetical protein MTP99_001849 [Tenebrio molitor]|nr:hypothetical protein MTP99_001849 [Tenebrio molitor]